ncbi:hypothetical protein CAXC1_40004 [Candidatus Xenohaliotis californiensis]|uniref:Uncharacterized protein n=1 Tax=Candidatus Xenohaliotis californiensis TaxID=84677 RepID=A0ABP0ETW5_9RICK|nr:hypothetical protein CAXC1_40004 [Candidatus Xenohaliotis californiensis]
MLLYTALFGVLIGTDNLKNRYYCNKKKNKRWVIYNGITEITKTPPEWRAWLSYTIDDKLVKHLTSKRKVIHTPNLTGTKFAYYPYNHKIKT